MTKETGGPAFPVQSVYIEDQETNSSGMTLRDHFAGLAMQAYMQITLKQYPTPGADSTWVGGPSYEAIAKTVYEIADSMLEARK